MVGDGADTEGSLPLSTILFRFPLSTLHFPLSTTIGRIHVELRNLHLHGQHAHALPAVVVGVGGVEHVGREHVAHLVAVAHALAGLHGAARQLEVGDGGEGAGQLVLRGVVGVGAGAGGYDEVADVEVLLDGAG